LEQEGEIIRLPFLKELREFFLGAFCSGVITFIRMNCLFQLFFGFFLLVLAGQCKAQVLFEEISELSGITHMHLSLTEMGGGVRF